MGGCTEWQTLHRCGESLCALYGLSVFLFRVHETFRAEDGVNGRSALGIEHAEGAIVHCHHSVDMYLEKKKQTNKIGKPSGTKKPKKSSSRTITQLDFYWGLRF